MHIALRERDGDVVLLQNLVNEFLALVHIFNLLRNKYILPHGHVHGTVSKVVEADVETVIGLYDFAAIGIFLSEDLQAFLQRNPYLFEVGSVGHAHFHDGELVGIVLGEVGETLAKQVRIQEGHLGSAKRLHHRGLVTDVHHFTAHAIALDPVAHPQAAAHELDTVNEVVQDILEGQTDTGRQTAGDESKRPGRDFQRNDEDVHVHKPDKHADEAVAQRQVDLVVADALPVVLAHEAVVLEGLPQGVDSLVGVTEHHEQTRQEEDVVDRYPEIALTDEGLLKEGVEQVVELEYVQRPVYTGGQGVQYQQRNQDFPD